MLAEQLYVIGKAQWGRSCFIALGFFSCNPLKEKRDAAQFKIPGACIVSVVAKKIFLPHMLTGADCSRQNFNSNRNFLT